ncbi:MAG: hypothetical protein JNJ90_17290 [Saprospiraceae bacterium]|jgi:hypothetical protein|nr:hypothetical protein [Saprospiraceae bacterium]
MRRKKIPGSLRGLVGAGLVYWSSRCECLRSLFLVLKFAGRLEQIRRHWPEILSFRIAHPDADRERILLQTRTRYLVNLHNMQPVK